MSICMRTCDTEDPANESLSSGLTIVMMEIRM